MQPDAAIPTAHLEDEMKTKSVEQKGNFFWTSIRNQTYYQKQISSEGRKVD